MDCTIANVGEKLIVGQLDLSFLTAGAKLLPGTAILNGPVYVGLTPQVGVARASCMIGPPLPPTPSISLEVTGISNFIGNINLTGIVNRFAYTNISGFTNSISAKITTGFSYKGAIDWSNAAKINSGFNLNYSFVQTPLTNSPIVNGFATGNKPFDIPHVVKKGKRIRHICVEAPAADIYIRGTLVDSNIIEIPEYWEGLVDLETLTVNLTPKETYQELFVDKMEWGKRIIIKNNAGGKINCDYQIWASRWINPMDHSEKLYVVYDGESPDDYPGNKESFLVGGWDYDKRNPSWKPIKDKE